MSSSFKILCPDRKKIKLFYSKDDSLRSKKETIIDLLKKWEEHCCFNWIKFGKKDIIMFDSEDLIKSFLNCCGTFLLLSNQRKKNIMSYKHIKKINTYEISVGDCNEVKEYKEKESLFTYKSKKTDLLKILELEKHGYNMTWCVVDKYGRFSFSGNIFYIYGNKEYSMQELKIRREIEEFYSMDKILIAYKTVDKVEKIYLGKCIVNKIIKMPYKNSFRFFDQNINEISDNIIE